MRVLLLLRGSPGCGKTTWIQQNGLANFAVSADDIRMMCSAPAMFPDGSVKIAVDSDKFVWDTLFKVVENRMRRGDFTVIDATNSKTVEMNRYKKLCEDYRYRIYCVDFTSVPIEVAKERNTQRSAYKVVPDAAIDKMYSRFETQKIPAGITVIQPDELDKVWRRKLDMSSYKKMHIIGDVHGCYTALSSYLEANGGIKDDEFYLFCGDYLDRGIENVEVLNFLLSIYNRPNVGLLEGNHERWIWNWANGETTRSKEFELFTRRQLEDAGVDKKECRKFYRRIGQCAWFDYAGKEFFVCHGGISRLPENLTLVGTEQMIKGVGSYNDFETVSETFAKESPENCIMIHGHRNTKDLPIRVNDKVRNLEGQVEFGGCLRVVQFSQDGTEQNFEIRNTVFREHQHDGENQEEAKTVGDLVLQMRGNKYIYENRFGNISSFNFTPSAFFEKAWNAQTMKARGLYINLDTQRIVARAYDKFFNINEREETKFDTLQRNLTFPVTAYVKENGFLGIVSYNAEADDLFITTKSNPGGEYAQYLRAMLYKKLSTEALGKIKNYTKEHDVSFVFECVDMQNDPHVIAYPDDELILLDVVSNSLKFEKKSYAELCAIADEFGIHHKELAFQLNTWQEFYDWYYRVTADDYTYNDRLIEGFVIEDANGKMVKLKLAYYKFWKFMRSIAAEVFKKGYSTRTSALTTDIANKFYGWCRKKYQSFKDSGLEYNGPKDICNLRSEFYMTCDE